MLSRGNLPAGIIFIPQRGIINQFQRFVQHLLKFSYLLLQILSGCNVTRRTKIFYPFPATCDMRINAFPDFFSEKFIHVHAIQDAL